MAVRRKATHNRQGRGFVPSWFVVQKELFGPRLAPPCFAKLKGFSSRRTSPLPGTNQTSAFPGQPQSSQARGEKPEISAAARGIPARALALLRPARLPKQAGRRGPRACLEPGGRGGVAPHPKPTWLFGGAPPPVGWTAKHVPSRAHRALARASSARRRPFTYVT